MSAAINVPTIHSMAISLSDVFYHSLTFLDHTHLSQCASVSREWRGLAVSDSLWGDLCDRLWSDKIYVSEKIRGLRRNKDSRCAFKLSLLDSRRTCVTVDELVSLKWTFRFKRRAGEEWISMDPYWSGEDPLQAFFEDNGSLRIINGHMGEVKRDEPDVLAYKPGGGGGGAAGAGTDGHDKTDGEFDKIFRWRFVTPLSTPDAPEGSAIRINNFPTFVVSRHPKNWGFVIQSCWVMIASFRLPAQGADPVTDDDKVELAGSWQALEMLAYNMGLPMETALTWARQQFELGGARPDDMTDEGESDADGGESDEDDYEEYDDEEEDDEGDVVGDNGVDEMEGYAMDDSARPRPVVLPRSRPVAAAAAAVDGESERESVLNKLRITTKAGNVEVHVSIRGGSDSDSESGPRPRGGPSSKSGGARSRSEPLHAEETAQYVSSLSNLSGIPSAHIAGNGIICTPTSSSDDIAATASGGIICTPSSASDIAAGGGIMSASASASSASSATHLNSRRRAGDVISDDASCSGGGHALKRRRIAHGDAHSRFDTADSDEPMLDTSAS